MEQLPENVLLVIIKKVVASGTQNLLRFKATTVYHKKLANKKAVLRALPRDCLRYISDHWPCVAKRKFMQQLSRSGHEEYCVVLAAKLLHEGRPDLKQIKLILQKAATRGSDGAKYFELMLKVLAKNGFLMNEVLPIFRDLFNRQRLSDCRRAIMNAKVAHSFWGRHWLRSFLPELEYRLICTSNGTCKGYGRRQNIFSPLLGTDEEYSTTHLCLSCRFDVELAWFLVHFRFIEDARF